MALFKKTESKKTKAAETTEKSLAVPSEKSVSVRGGIAFDAIIRRPHVTERATELSERGVYVFEIDSKATKAQVKQAIEKLYKVHVVRVATINTKAKYTRSKKTNRVVVKKQAYRKALVTLKAGEKILRHHSGGKT
ncbi:MAG: 50S ribosomal protein L23 [Candidatus Giovannonibacteria bacterium GW2011_GWA2_53_7]|uniref:Large ribosomal subunit protein uL23 n=1 Tax=Candidatus Giovannonibacteria bacterium GW2011_GWA2_53_7 TaxID=1618650 RepID=A0A0G2A8A0_9BACT|nr:MAG: 50S ribosomal protein L23 [Candidatus Giovannonibacteria bacterium GW2011_GWA2_53_7]